MAESHKLRSVEDALTESAMALPTGSDNEVDKPVREIPPPFIKEVATEAQYDFRPSRVTDDPKEGSARATVRKTSSQTKTPDHTSEKNASVVKGGKQQEP